MAHSISWDGTDLAGSSYGLTVVSGGFPVVAPQRLDVQEIPYAPDIAQGKHSGARAFSVDVMIVGTSTANLEAILDNLAALFDVERDTTKEKSLEFDDYFNGRYWMVRYQGGLEDADFEGDRTCTATLNFIAPDPFGHNTTERTSPDFTLTGTSHVIAVESGGAPGGTAIIRPVWILKDPTATGASTLVLNNTTTLESITWPNNLADNEWLEIDSQAQHIRKSVDSGANWTDSMGGVFGTFPTLDPDRQNSVTISGMTDGMTLTLTYRKRYL